MAKEILIADSDKAVQQEFQKIFETTDYHLVFSESGEDVLLRIKLFKPDLIIAGTSLSEKSGFELCEAIKGDREFKMIPFILLLDVPEEISEKDRKRLKPDGILSKPLDEGRVLNMVDRLLEGMRTKEEGIPPRETKPQSPTNVKKEALLDEFVETGEDEVIDLLDVVEEAEPRMSIDDFAIQEKEESLGEITPLESWERLEGEEKLAAEEGFVLSLKEQKVKEEIPLRLEKELTPRQPAQEEEVFEKIELEDILEKLGQGERAAEREEPLERQARVFEEKPPTEMEAEEKTLGLEEFETLLKKGVEAEPSKAESIEETLQPFSLEEAKVEAPEEMTPIEIPEEELEELEELAEEEFPKGLLEEALKEETAKEVGGLEEEEIGILEEEEIKGFEAEEFEVIEEPEEILKPEEIEELKEEKIELFEELEAPKIQKEELEVIEEPQPIKAEKPEEMEAQKFFEEVMGPPSRKAEQQMEEVISEKVRAMMEEFITKHVPSMTKDIVGLTIDRIEKMVREIVPDLAAKMIEEEIKRLEKGEPN